LSEEERDYAIKIVDKFRLEWERSEVEAL